MMRSVLYVLIVLAYSAAQEYTTDTINDKLNTVEPNPSVRLDPYIRKALLKALSDLEESANISDIQSTGSTQFDAQPTSASLTTSPTQTIKENIQIHSFVVNGQEAFKNNSNVTPTLLDHKISILSSTVGNVENYATATLPTQSPFNEIFQAKETGVNLQQIRSISSTSKANFASSGLNKISTNKPRLISTTSSTTSTTTTTTTTTPKPTHDEDGLNIEEVDKRDVQVFQAPLVAAFTVHQDAQGVPKKVIPIYQQTNNQSPLESVISATHVIPPTNIPKVPHQQFIAHQLDLQRQLEEKQRILEEQLRFLQLQQRQQEELLRRQNYLLQQKEAQRQQLYSIDQQGLQQIPKQQNNLVTIKNTNVRQPTSPVSIQPSITLEQNNLVGNLQQLPNREAVDFLINLRSQHSEQFPLQDNHLPAGISSFLQPSPVTNFVQNHNTNPITQGNRVFRHESGVGNLGVNNPNYNRFSQFGPVLPVHTNGFFPIHRPNQFNSGEELKHLLVQTGLNGRAHEDLNIVTKVLSLNHGIPVNTSNRLFFDGRRHARPGL